MTARWVNVIVCVITSRASFLGQCWIKDKRTIVAMPFISDVGPLFETVQFNLIIMAVESQLFMLDAWA